MPVGEITADSKPVYCLFGGSDCWTCNDLITWHIALVAKYGSAEANKRFIDSWTNDSPVICEQYDCRSFNSTFRDYFSKVGILPSLYSGIGVIAQPIGFGTDLAGNLGDAITNASKVLKYLVPTLVTVVAIVLVVYIVKQVRFA